MRGFYLLGVASAIVALVAPTYALAKIDKARKPTAVSKGSKMNGIPSLGNLAGGLTSAAASAAAAVPGGAGGVLSAVGSAAGAVANVAMEMHDSHQIALAKLHKAFGTAVDELPEFGVIANTPTCQMCLALNFYPYKAKSWNNIWVPIMTGDGNQACFRSTYVMKKIVGITNPSLCPTQMQANLQMRELRNVNTLFTYMQKFNYPSAPEDKKDKFFHRFDSQFVSTMGLDEPIDTTTAAVSDCHNCLALNKEDPNTKKIGMGLWNNVWNVERGLCFPSRSIPVIGVTGEMDMKNCANPIATPDATEIGAEGKVKAIQFYEGSNVMKLSNTNDEEVRGPESKDCHSCTVNNLAAKEGADMQQDRYNLLWDVVLGQCVYSSSSIRKNRNGIMDASMCPTTEQEKFAIFYLARVGAGNKDAAAAPIMQTCQGCTMMNRAPFIQGEANMAFVPNKKSGGTDPSGKPMKCIPSTELSPKREDYVIDPGQCSCVDQLGMYCLPFVSQASCLQLTQMFMFRSLHGANASAASGLRADASLQRSYQAMRSEKIGSEEAVNAEIELNQKIGEKQCMADQFGSIMGQMPKCVWQNFDKNNNGVKECKEGAQKTMPGNANLEGLCQMFTAMKGVLSSDAKSCSASEQNQMAKINMNGAAAKVSAPKKMADHVFFRQVANTVAEKVARATASSNPAPALSLSLFEEMSHEFLDSKKYHDTMVFTKENLRHLSASEIPEYKAPEINAFNELVAEVGAMHGAWKRKHFAFLEEYRKTNYRSRSNPHKVHVL